MERTPAEIQERIASHRALRKKLVPLLLVSAILFVLLACGGLIVLIICKESGADHHTLENIAAVGNVGFGFALILVISSCILLRNSRCPMCDTWVHPRYYPTRKSHCPHCGKTLPDDAGKNAGR